MKKDLNDEQIATRYIRKAQSSRDRGIEFTLSFTSYKNLLMAEKCFYTGIAMTRTRPPTAPKSTDQTIDRIDSSIGYVKGNVVSCCDAANQLKARCESGAPLNINGAIRVLTKARNAMRKTKGN